MAYLSNKTGYTASREATKNTPYAQRMKNVHSLQAAMTPLIVIPWLICAGLYCSLHLFLPRDLARTRAAEKKIEEGETTDTSHGKE